METVVPHREERPGAAHSRRDQVCLTVWQETAGPTLRGAARGRTLQEGPSVLDSLAGNRGSHTARSGQELHSSVGTKRVLRVRGESRKPRSHTARSGLGPHTPGGSGVTRHASFKALSLLFTNNVLIAYHDHRIAIVVSASRATRVRAPRRLRTSTQDPHNGGRWNEEIAHASPEDDVARVCTWNTVKKCHPRKKPLPHPRRKGPSLLSNSEHTVSVWRSGMVHGRPSALLRLWP